MPAECGGGAVQGAAVVFFAVRRPRVGRHDEHGPPSVLIVGYVLFTVRYDGVGKCRISTIVD